MPFPEMSQVRAQRADLPCVTASPLPDLAQSRVADSLLQYLRRETSAVWALSAVQTGVPFGIVSTDGTIYGYLCLVTEDHAGRHRRIGAAVANALPALMEAEARSIADQGMPLEAAPSSSPGLDAPDNRMVAYFQPIVSLRSGHVMAIEALARIITPDGVLGPDSFLHLYRTPRGMLGVFDRMLASALEFLAEQHLRVPDLSVSVNLELAAIPERGFADLVQGHLERSGVPGELLTLELNERMPYTVEGSLRQQLLDATSLGVDLVLDDFPSSTRALEALRGVPVVGAKLDRSFVRQLNAGQRGEDDLRAILRRAHEFGIEIIAEGVETPRQRDALVGLGYRFGQGYAFAVPQPGASIAMLLDAPLVAGA